ncbi:unnamed protein product [Phaedon cochleariae]|uniref:ubiquitinyl hydrolase 1 n=1 Tax=Phaedon cochleariae TaxID=80249 RepID=A0A9N9SEN1_PHACE|nr:unnamed protein product [Phaedon cochleariae]
MKKTLDIREIKNQFDKNCGRISIHKPIGRTLSPQAILLGLKGLKNIGNACFINSVNQCLSITKRLPELILNDDYMSFINTTRASMKGELFTEFAKVIKELWWSEDSSDSIINATFCTLLHRICPAGRT